MLVIIDFVTIVYALLDDCGLAYFFSIFGNGRANVPSTTPGSK